METQIRILLKMKSKGIKYFQLMIGKIDLEKKEIFLNFFNEVTEANRK